VVEVGPQSPALVFVAAEGWHPGVIGIVAARLKERYQRPACVVALAPGINGGGIGKGSGRSISGVDLGAAVRHAVAAGLLMKGGGHAMAAGVTLVPDKLADFRAYLEETLAGPVEAARHEDSLLIDGALTAAGATVALHADIARAGPYGAGHVEPVFAFPAHTIAYAEEVGQAHVRARLRAGDGAMINAIAFRAAGKPLGKALLDNRGRNVHTAGTLSIDRYQGEERLQFRVMDLATTDPVSAR
jgi:single-stranded-DNA-specific exonuclease